MSDNFLKSICFLKMVDVVPERAAKIRMLSATAQPQPLLLWILEQNPSFE